MLCFKSIIQQKQYKINAYQITFLSFIFSTSCMFSKKKHKIGLYQCWNIHSIYCTYFRLLSGSADVGLLRGCVEASRTTLSHSRCHSSSLNIRPYWNIISTFRILLCFKITNNSCCKPDYFVGSVASATCATRRVSDCPWSIGNVGPCVA